MAAALFSCGRIHVLNDGIYAQQLKRVLKDECQLATEPRVLAPGRLRTTGDVVAFDHALFDTRLVGQYLSSIEKVRLDGTASKVVARVNGRDCLLDTATLHFEATAIDSTHFDGSLSVRLDARQPEACVCELWLEQSGQWVGP